MAAPDIEIGRLSTAIENAYGIITRNAVKEASDKAIRRSIVVNNQRAAELAVSALKGIVPNIDMDGININAFTLQQREALRDLITRTQIYQKIKAFNGGGAFPPGPIEFNLDSPNPFTTLTNATQLQTWLLPGKWVEDNVMCLAPTFNLRTVLTGDVPLAHGWDQTRVKPTAAGLGDGYKNIEVNNLGLNVMPLNGWFNYIGVSDTQGHYGNNSDDDPETSTGTSKVGYSRRTSFNYETVFGSPFALITDWFAQSSMVLKGEYFRRKDERAIETNQDPSRHSQGYNIDIFETLHGPWGIGGYLNQEWGSVTPVAKSDFGFARTNWGAKLGLTGLTENFRYKLSTYVETGVYTQGTIAGDIQGFVRNPSRPSLSPIYSTEDTKANQGKKLNAENYDQTAKGINLELEYLNNGGFAPIIFKLGAKDHMYMRNEPVWKYNVGLGLGRWAGVDYSMIYNNIPEIRSFSEGKPRDLTHRVDGFVYLDLIGAGSKIALKKETDLNAGLRLSGWYMRDDHTPHNPSWGVSLALEMGFNTGITKKTQNVNQVVIPSKFYVAADESPNNRAMMEKHYEGQYSAARAANKLLEDGMLIRPVPRSNP